jgi:hypothetical protein
MAESRQWVVDTLRRMGYSREADEAAQELPDPVNIEELTEFGRRHGISRDELVSRMGGSPLPSGCHAEGADPGGGPARQPVRHGITPLLYRTSQVRAIPPVARLVTGRPGRITRPG